MTTDNLYVIKRTVFDPRTTTEAGVNISLPMTFTSLKAAEHKAKTVLIKEGYDLEFFSFYDVNGCSKDWKHGEGVFVYAIGPAEEVYQVEIDAVPDKIGLQSDSTGRVKAPLHHVVQTIIEHNENHCNSQPCSIVMGTHTNLRIARKEALWILLGGVITRDDFVEYQEFSGDTDKPYGEDVVVYAVNEVGQTILVSVISDHKIAN